VLYWAPDHTVAMNGEPTAIGTRTPVDLAAEANGQVAIGFWEEADAGLASCLGVITILAMVLWELKEWATVGSCGKHTATAIEGCREEEVARYVGAEIHYMVGGPTGVAGALERQVLLGDQRRAWGVSWADEVIVGSFTRCEEMGILREVRLMATPEPVTSLQIRVVSPKLALTFQEEECRTECALDVTRKEVLGAFMYQSGLLPTDDYGAGWGGSKRRYVTAIGGTESSTSGTVPPVALVPNIIRVLEPS